MGMTGRPGVKGRNGPEAEVGLIDLIAGKQSNEETGQGETGTPSS